MEEIRQYLVTVTAAGLFCGLVKSLFPDRDTAGNLIRLMAGLFLTVTVAAPLAHISPMDWEPLLPELEEAAAAAAAEGEKAAAASAEAIIKSRLEAYILGKAEALGATVTAEVRLTQKTPPLPERVVIRGPISPYGRTRLEAVLEEDLGIAKEQIIWTG